MRIGTGLIVAGIGAILRYAVEDNWDDVDLGAIGTILMVIGIVAFLTAVSLEWNKTKTAAAASRGGTISSGSAPAAPTPPPPSAANPPASTSPPQ